MRLALALAALALFVPASATADTWCVSPASGCDHTATDPQDGLDQARNNAGPDTIVLGAATYTTAGLVNANSPGPGGPVEIDGAGITATNIAINGAGKTILASSGGAPITVKHLTLTTRGAPASIGKILDFSGGTSVVDDVKLIGDAALGDDDSRGVTGITQTGGTLTVTNSQVLFNLGTSDHAVLTKDASATIADTVTTADPGIQVQGGDVRLERVDASGILSSASVQPGAAMDGSLTIDSSVIRPVNAGQGMVVTDSGIHDARLTARHVTVVGPGGQGLTVNAFSRHASAVVDSSIFRGQSPSIVRGHTGSGVADVSVDYSDFAAGSAVEQPGPGGGTLTLGSHNVDVDPLFAGASDFHLTAASPLIDAGNPVLDPDGSATDLDGLPRAVANSASCTRPADIGAYEIQHRQPVAAAAIAADNVPATMPATFDASASCDATPDEPLTYAWSFDDGGSATGAVVQHTFATPGAHSGTVTVTDTASATATATAPITIGPAPVRVTQAPPLLPPVTPPQATTFAGVLELGSHTLKVDRHRYFRWKFSCPATTTGSCAETVTVTAPAASLRPAKAVKIASSKFTIKPGKTTTVKLRLSTTAFRKLRPRHKLKASAAIASKDGASHSAAKTVKVAFSR